MTSLGGHLNIISCPYIIHKNSAARSPAAQRQKSFSMRKQPVQKLFVCFLLSLPFP